MPSRNAGAAIRWGPGTRLDRRRLALAGCAVIVLGLYLAIAMQYGRSIKPPPTRAMSTTSSRTPSRTGTRAFPSTFRQVWPRSRTPTIRGQRTVPGRRPARPLRRRGRHLQLLRRRLPALSLVLPFRVLGIGDVTPLLATFVFLSVGYLFLALLYLRLARLLPRPPGLLLRLRRAALLGLAHDSAVHHARSPEPTRRRSPPGSLRRRWGAKLSRWRL